MSNKRNFRFQGELTSLIWCVSAGAICFAAHILVSESTGLSPAVSGLIFLFAYLAAVASVGFIIYRYRKTHGAYEEQLSNNSNAIRDLLQQANLPIMLTDGHGKIIWYNDELAVDFEVGMSAIGTDMHSFCPVTESQLIEATVAYHSGSTGSEVVDPSLAVININGRRYRAKASSVVDWSNDRKFVGTLDALAAIVNPDGSVFSLGNAAAYGPIRSMCTNKAKTHLWGVAGDDEDMGYVFEYDDISGLRQRGIVNYNIPNFSDGPSTANVLSSVCLSPDEKYLAIGSCDRIAQVHVMTLD